MASIERTAYPRFKRTISSRELRNAFTPTSDEIGWAQERTTTDQHKLALVVLLKCYQRRTGKIMAQTGHRNVTTVHGYIREGDPLLGNAVTRLGL